MDQLLKYMQVDVCERVNCLIEMWLQTWVYILAAHSADIILTPTTPLHCAASYGKPNLIKLLYENGGDIGISQNEQGTRYSTFQCAIHTYMINEIVLSTLQILSRAESAIQTGDHSKHVQYGVSEIGLTVQLL